jgi:hypothetical protein
MALPNEEGSKRYTTYLELVDSGSSGSLINGNIVKHFVVEQQKKSTKWDTATGVLLTKGRVTIENCSLPQFTRK